MTVMSRKWVLLPLAAVTALLAACSSTGTHSSSGGAAGASSGATSAATSGGITPHPVKATGTPVKIGFVSDGESSALNMSFDHAGVTAAADYANDYLGGIAGRPIDLQICDDDNTPAGATQCADNLIQGGAVALVSAVDAQADTVSAKAKSAKIPYFIWTGGGGNTEESPYASIFLSTQVTVIWGPAEMLKQAGAKQVGVVDIDVPATRGQYNVAFPPAFKAAGLSVNVSFVPPNAADFTPQVQSLISKGDNGLLIVGAGNFCISALKAIKTLDFSGPVAIVEQCLGPGFAGAVPGGLKGLLTVSQNAADASDPQFALYEKVLKAYEPSADPTNNITQGGFGAMLGLVRALSGLKGSVTSATVKAAAASAAPQTLPLSANIKFQCNRHQVPGLPALCTATQGLGITLDAAGNRAKTTVLNLNSIMSAATSGTPK